MLFILIQDRKPECNTLWDPSSREACSRVMAPDLFVVVCIPSRKCSDFPHGRRKLKPLKTKETVAVVQVGRESKERCCSHYSLITSAYEP